MPFTKKKKTLDHIADQASIKGKRFPLITSGGFNSVGRVPRLHRGCQRFEPVNPQAVSVISAKSRAPCGNFVPTGEFIPNQERPSSIRSKNRWLAQEEKPS